MANQTKPKLGKGLDAIFGGDITSVINDIEKNTPKSSQTTVLLDEIRPNPYQPRRFFDEDKLAELAQSIKQHGVFTPVILKPSVQGYEIVAGERRVRACRMAGLNEIPAILVEFTDDQMMEVALLENIQREDLNAIEEAQAYKTMMDRFGLTQEKLSERIGKSRSHIANTMRLLSLPEKVQEYVLDGKLTMGHVRPLVTLDTNKAIEIAQRAIQDKLSARDVENIVRGLELGQMKRSKPKVEKDQHFIYVEDLMRKKYGTKIKVEESAITIKYNGVDDLNRILEIMGLIEE